jgi:DNA-binding NtrC family response regulator
VTARTAAGTEETGTVLVVDDSDVVRLLLRVNLETEHHRVLEADSVADARRILAAETIHLVLLGPAPTDAETAELRTELEGTLPDLRIESTRAYVERFGGFG